MEKLAGYELSLHSSTYVHKNLIRLQLPEIPLRVPTIGETMLINSSEVNETRQIVIETNVPCRQLDIARSDGQPLQVMQADTRRDTYGNELFTEPVRSLALTCIYRFTWLTDVDEENITDSEMMREFVGILASFAVMKQTKLLDS